MTSSSQIPPAAEEPENVVVCPDESSARTEAAQREALDPERDRYFWHGVCLDGQWIAKRYLRADAQLTSRGNWIDDLLGFFR